MFFNGSNNVDTEYYDILELNKNASANDIKKAYRKLAKKYHPDKTDENLKEEYTKKFQKISEAYEVLSDESKKKVYDQYGKNGLKNDGMNVNPFDIFSNMFNFTTNKTKSIKKTSPILHQVNISLEDLYNGRTIKLKITKKGIFNKISNTLCDVHTVHNSWGECQECNGCGVKTEIRNIRPGFMSQTQRPCSFCNGTGKILNNDYELREYQDIIKIEINSKINIKEEYIIKNAGDCRPGFLPGDIIIVFKLKPHDIFKLEKNNLIINKTITLVEALCGFNFVITYLNGEKININSTNIITPDKYITIDNLGIYDKNGNRGKLILYFKIIFPNTLTTQTKNKVSKYLSCDGGGNNGGGGDDDGGGNNGSGNNNGGGNNGDDKNIKTINI